MAGKSTKSKRNLRPRPPDDMSPDALVEFHRVCDVLEEEERIEDADAALITLYAQTWAAYQEAVAGVRKTGVVTVFTNGNAGPSAHLKVMKELGRLLRGLLRDLDLAPGPRGKSDMDVQDLEL